MNECVSVVIPVYNSSLTISECLNSVYNELIVNNISWEIIIIDDGSTDDSTDKISYFKNSHPLDEIILIRQSNSGAAEARNAGLKIAKGDLIAFNDADDEWLQGKLSLQLKYLEQYSDIDMIGCLHGPAKLFFPWKKTKYLNHISINDMLFRFYFTTPGVVFKKKILKETGLFPMKRRNAEEGILFYKMVFFGNCSIINQSFTRNILGKHSIGVSGLTGQIHKQSRGELINLRTIYKDNVIGIFQYTWATIFSMAKYARRVFWHSFKNTKNIHF